MAVLGLLHERLDSASRVAVRLERESPHGRWSRTTNYAIFLELAERGAIRKVRPGKTPPDDLYETTPSGATEFNEWLREAVKAPPRIRDPMHAWVQHSEESDLPEMIRAIREMQESWRTEYEKAQERLNTELRLGRLGPSDGSDWQGRKRYTALKDMMTMCAQQVKRCMALRALLENREMHPEAPEVGDG
jgi:DNA-binding PadR family transcriptional regulator